MSGCCELHSNLVSLHSETTSEFSNSIGSSCELHSNLVSLHSETTTPRMSWIMLRLWITFKSCIFAFWNNYNLYLCQAFLVVNYIQILYLCILKQRATLAKVREASCELHSNLVSLHSETTWYCGLPGLRGLWITFKSCIFAFWNNNVLWLVRPWLLWITFKSCIFAFWNNGVPFPHSLSSVVNYIQILYLCILKQLDTWITYIGGSCELHSNLVSLHSETTKPYAITCRM